MWKSLTISVGDAAQLPVVRGDVAFFRDVLASLASGGRFECAITGRVLDGDGCLAGVASSESKERVMRWTLWTQGRRCERRATVGGMSWPCSKQKRWVCLFIV